MPTSPFHIAGISGSLRKSSFNSALLRYAQRIAPEHGLSIDVLEIGNLPLYNTDLEQTMPKDVTAMKEKVKGSDGLLIVSPEYNYSIPGALKNALDWLSRPYGQNSAASKPAAIMGGSTGMVATARMQSHLRQVLQYLNCPTLAMPEVLVPAVQEKINEQGEITDEKTKQKIAELLDAFQEWIEQLKK